ncbi:contactin-associated protein-like 4 isoform X1 [Clavelina lepadiformis]|uniref:contactin-associated protein-like 4 isoform X1 n=1 Tax=Clavelina lepadiformis TaxID=159417 RepID=UPI004042B4F2
MTKQTLNYIQFTYSLQCMLSVSDVVEAPGDDRTCTGVTNIHYHCGGESFFPGVENGNQSGSFKGSYRGKAGPKGDKGSQGEPGTNEEIENELSLLKQEVAELRQRLDNQAIPRSCAEVNETAHTASGRYIISPNPFRVLPFSVSCDFSNGVAETIVHHDSETEITISKCEPSRCYNRKVDYQLSIDQVAALVDVSTSCRQFIKLRCLGVQPFLNRNPSIAAWVSRNATAKTYWGGVTPDEIGCACGLTGTCATSSRSCNCDNGSTSQQYVDDGDLTHKPDLPVTGLLFGDNGDDSEKAWHTLGPLICTGIN